MHLALNSGKLVQIKVESPACPFVFICLVCLSPLVSDYRIISYKWHVVQLVLRFNLSPPAFLTDEFSSFTFIENYHTSIMFSAFSLPFF